MVPHRLKLLPLAPICFWQALARRNANTFLILPTSHTLTVVLQLVCPYILDIPRNVVLKGTVK